MHYISCIFFAQKSYSDALKAVLFVLTHILYILKVVEFQAIFYMFSLQQFIHSKYFHAQYSAFKMLKIELQDAFKYAYYIGTMRLTRTL